MLELPLRSDGGPLETTEYGGLTLWRRRTYSTNFWWALRCIAFGCDLGDQVSVPSLLVNAMDDIQRIRLYIATKWCNGVMLSLKSSIASRRPYF